MKAFKKRMQAITEGFVKEVLVCCDLAHPNLVRMMGYSANPRSKGTGLCLIQEFLEGKALDHQLYVEGWRPNELQVLKAAVDVARGMRHLHHHFQIDGRPRPVVHRDLKSPNLLLTSPPPRSSLEPHAEIKITDFGLTRDKEMEEAAMKTGVMTGCGSVLWMAPEILLAGTCASPGLEPALHMRNLPSHRCFAQTMRRWTCSPSPCAWWSSSTGGCRGRAHAPRRRCRTR